jgi:hypothetical protein
MKAYLCPDVRIANGEHCKRKERPFRPENDPEKAKGGDNDQQKWKCEAQ